MSPSVAEAALSGGLTNQGLREPLSKFQPVLALTITRLHDNKRQILLGVRSPECNSTHQNVVSVPTLRMQDFFLVERLAKNPTAPIHGHPDAQGLGHVVGHLLGQKIGLGDGLERGSVSFRPLYFGCWQGFSLIGFRNGVDDIEALTMCNLAIDLTNGDVPLRTSSYLRLDWVDVSSFRRAAKSREVLDLGIVLDLEEQVDWCIRGLCLETTRLVLDAMDF